MTLHHLRLPDFLHHPLEGRRQVLDFHKPLRAPLAARIDAVEHVHVLRRAAGELVALAGEREDWAELHWRDLQRSGEGEGGVKRGEERREERPAQSHPYTKKIVTSQAPDHPPQAVILVLSKNYPSRAP